MAAGETLQFSATGTCSAQPKAGVEHPTQDCDVNDPSWHSDNQNAISISTTGLATGGTAIGTVTITATKDGVTSNSITLNSQGRILRSIVVTGTDPTTGAPSNATAPGGSVKYTAQGVYSDNPTPQNITDTIINWTIDDPNLGTLSATQGQSILVKAPDDSQGGQTTVHASVSVNGTPITGDALFGVGILTSLAINPNTDSKPLGRASALLTAIGTYSPPSGTPFTMPIASTWTASNDSGTGTAPTLDTACDGKLSTTCKVTGHAVGKVTITATIDSPTTQTATATLTVTAAVLDHVEITPDPVGTDPRTTPDSFDLPRGASQNFYALYYYSDFPGVPVVSPRTAADLVVWSSSAPTTVSIAPAPDNAIKATGLAQSTANLVATAAGSVTDSVAITVGPAEIQQLLGVRPAKAYVGVGRQQEFTAYGVYSTGETRDIADGKVTWSSSKPTIASINATTGVATASYTPDADGATITATLNTDPDQHATATMIVTAEACTAPLTTDDGATAIEGPDVGICIACNVSHPERVVDPDNTQAGTINVGVGALNASRSIDVTASAADAPYDVPFAAGSRPAFIISNANGPLLLAEVASQIQMSTLLNGAVQETTDNAVTPLRLDLLGAELVSVNKTQGLVSFLTSKKYDAIRIQLKSGLATALSSVEVYQACGNSLLPVQPASGISSLETAGVASGDEPGLEAGASLTLVAHDYADPSKALNADDVNWTSSDPSLATVSPTGVVTGVGEGEVTITGMLKDTSVCGTHCSATRMIKVSAAVCEVPLQMSQGASIDSLLSGLCLTCSTTNLNNVVDADPQTYGSVFLPVALLNAAVTVTATVETPYAAFTAGPTAGFVVAASNGALLSAEIGNQIVVRTLKGGEATGDASNKAATPLRLDLLGTAVIGDLGTTAQPLFISTTKDFDAVQITFSSGLASALSSYKLYAACGKGPQ